jgi:hypothetical protein
LDIGVGHGHDVDTQRYETEPIGCNARRLAVAARGLARADHTIGAADDRVETPVHRADALA